LVWASFFTQSSIVMLLTCSVAELATLAWPEAPSKVTAVFVSPISPPD
jgi:hypothetical protein